MASTRVLSRKGVNLYLATQPKSYANQCPNTVVSTVRWIPTENAEHKSLSTVARLVAKMLSKYTCTTISVAVTRFVIFRVRFSLWYVNVYISAEYAPNCYLAYTTEVRIHVVKTKQNSNILLPGAVVIAVVD